MFIILLIHLVYSGTLWPTSSPIHLSISNRYEYANYTFTMVADTEIPSGGVLQIIFPSQYLSGLGIDLVVDGTCSVVCTVQGYQVDFTLENDVLANETFSVIINNVKNPESKGGTGNFIVRSKLGQNVFDENLIFSTIGIADYALDFNAMIIKIDENSTNVVNQNALYDFYIKSPIDLPEGFYIQITSPLTSDLSTCQLIPYNKTTLTGTISCTQGIVVTGFPSVSALYTFGLQLNFMNPAYSQTTPDFRVVAYRKDTTMAYAWRSSVSGVYIAPSSFLNITITPGSQKSAIISDYVLSMKLANTVPTQGSVVIQLPLNFELAAGYDYIYVTSGITSDSLTITSTLYDFEISSFDKIPIYSDIVIVFRVVNPQLPGLSASFIVQTTYDGSNVIDECSTNLGIVIQDSVTYSPVSATISNPYAGQNTNFQFTISSTQNTAIRIVIDFGSQFTYSTITPINSQCLLNGLSSSSCTLNSSIITAIFPSTIGSTATISFNGFLIAPPSAVNQFLVYDTYDASNNAVESGSLMITIYPRLDSTAIFQWIGLGLSTSTVNLYATLQATFTPSVKIPAQIIIDTQIDEGTTDEGTTDESAADEGTTDEGTTDESTTDEGTTTDPTYPTLTPPSPHGEIWLQFGPLLTWADDLGITKLFCLTNLVAITDYDIECTLYSGSTTTYPEIRIKNFQEVAANTAITIKITGICNPQLTPITVTAYSGIRQYSNRVTYDFATVSIPLSTVVPLSESTITSTFSTSSQSVNQNFNLVFQPGFSAAVPTGSVVRILLPGYENGFLQSTSTCTVDSTVMACDKFLYIDWLEITLTSAATTTSTITLSNLLWPSTSTQIGYIHWIIFTTQLETSKAVVQGSGSTQFPAPLANDFYTATALSYQTGRGFPGQIFHFQFSTTNSIPDGAIMIITFPTEFSWQSSTPTPSCNGYDPDSITLSAKTSKTLFDVICVGIKTPANPPDTLSDGWSVTIYVDGRILNQRNDFFEYTYTNIFTQGTINIKELYAIPLNINEVAIYTITFEPENMLLVGAQIYITFPSTNFPELPYPPILADCDINGGVDSFESCLLDGSSFIIILNKIYESGSITFMINNVQNPTTTITDGFMITTYYDGVLIDSTDQSTLLNRTITYNSVPDSLVINSFQFAPQNAGIVAVYKFNISASTSTVNGSIVITFPTTYDQRLGDNLKAYVNNINTTLTVNNRILTIPESQYTTSYNSLLVEIWNIVNPNTDANSNTGEFKIGITQSDQYVQYNGSVGVLEMMDPPGWLYLRTIELANQYSRWQSKYTFNITLYNDVPSNGYLEMDFPADYEISDQSSATCNFTSCTFSSNILKAYIDSVNGEQSLYVYIENPLFETTISKFVLQSKDDRSIVEQSYPNLDPFSFAFTYSGPLIYINGDSDITVPQGAESPDILFQVLYPMALNLTFKHTQTDNFLVTPKEISFSYTTMSATFRVQIPESLSVGTYYIYWQTFGEKSNPIYTPIKKSRVIVVAKTIPISVTALYPIPNAGNSLNMILSTLNAPYSLTTVTITSNDQTFYFTADQQSGSSITLTFQLGINQQTFRVYQNYTELVRETQLDILTEDDRIISFATDNSLYKIPSSLIVKYIDAITTAPTIKLAVNNITQFTATITITTNQISEAYYMYCLNRTTAPDQTELLNLGPPLHMTTLSKYGYLNILASSSLTLNLYSQTDYVFYIVLLNQQGLLSEIKYVNFTTLNRSSIAQFTLTAAFSANQAQIVTIMNNIAFILSLPSTKIQQKITYASTTKRRNLLATNLQLYILPFNDTSDYPSPKELITKINSDAQFKRLMLIYLTSCTISGIAVAKVDVPELKTYKLLSSYLYDCEISIELSTYGYVFAIASQTDSSTPFQVFKGLNNINIAVPSANQHVTNLTTINFNISNLEPNTTYKIYLVSASDLPEYPELSGTVQSLECSTLKLTERAPQEISFNIILVINLILLII